MVTRSRKGMNSIMKNNLDLQLVSQNSSKTAQWASRALVSLATGSAALLLAACGTTVSQGINDQGQADNLVFPDATQSATVPEGSYPTKESLQLVASGMSKSQIYQLIGAPHFQEGFGAREWDYIFHFRSAGQDKTCQYKLIFDRDMKVGTTHWQPAECAPASAPNAQHEADSSAVSGSKS